MAKKIAILVCVMMIILTGCGKSTRKVTMALGEVGTVNLDPMGQLQDGLKTVTQRDDDLTVTVVKDGTYYFHVTNDSGKDVEVVMTVQKDDVSVKSEDGIDVSFTIK